MLIKYYIFKLILIFLFFCSSSVAKETKYFDEGLLLFKNRDYDKSKIFFEKNIVFNPKHEKSYLYLAKIFKRKNNDTEEEVNLNNVLLINPKNDEALYMLIELKIKQSDYNQTKELMEKFILVCDSFCKKKEELLKKFSKITPENE
tara:strand:+ start:534 stop:971 length:438 start_codon:yes stop_codon:yes gene_type:complete